MVDLGRFEGLRWKSDSAHAPEAWMCVTVGAFLDRNSCVVEGKSEGCWSHVADVVQPCGMER